MKDLSLEEILKILDEKYPFVPHTNAGRLYSTVRRMKAEEEFDIPINMRSGHAVAVSSCKSANEMSEEEWHDFYSALCQELKNRYPELYTQIFGADKDN